jgi:hypothetical protein
VEGARADFHVVRLEQGATLLVPVGLQGQDDLLECEHLVGFARTRAANTVSLLKHQF